MEPAGLDRRRQAARPPSAPAGYIKAGDGPLAGLAQCGARRRPAPRINGLVIFGLVAVGISLMLGLLTRAGCLGGLALLAMFYFTAIPTTGLPQTGAEGTYLFVNKTLIEGVAVLALFMPSTPDASLGWTGCGSERQGRAGPSVSLDRHTFAEGSGS